MAAKLVRHLKWPKCPISFRFMQDHERRDVQDILRRAFPQLDQWAFSWTPNVLVAEQLPILLGAIVLKLFALPHQRKAGSVVWVYFTAPEARGRGVGQRLVEAGIDFCDFDIARPFFPFISFNGKRLWDWNQGVWARLAVATIALFWV